MPDPTTPSAPTSCPRCKMVTLVVLEPSPEITFYQCSRCERHYARKPGMELVDRWLSPVSLALYGVIYEPDAVFHAPRIARQLASSMDRASVEALAREIQRELDEPTQRVVDILDMAALKSEEHLREYLRMVVEHLRQANERDGQSPGSH